MRDARSVTMGLRSMVWNDWIEVRTCGPTGAVTPDVHRSRKM
jgi:hypothetical protein